MKKFFTMFLHYWTKSPIKIILTLFAVAFGTCILILSFSISSILDEEVQHALSDNGVILHTANGSWDADGTIAQHRPVEWDKQALSIVASDIDEIEYVSLIKNVPFDQVTTDGVSYTLRKAIATDQNYFSIYDLEIVAGLPMTTSDLDLGAKKMWISEETATLLYGSADAAIGRWIQPPAISLRRGMKGTQQNVIIQYSVAGVFADPSEIARRSYGISDVIIPYTSIITAGMNVAMAQDLMSGMFVVKSTGTSVESVEASIRQVLTQNYGDDIEIEVWEGSPKGISTYMEELRQTVSVFSTSVRILGVVLLLVSSLGIFSIMVVEALGRRKDIALERALGASRGVVIREFWTWSLALSFMGASVGVLLAMALESTVLGTLAPLVGEISDQFSAAMQIKPEALIESLLLVLGCGGILGILPVIPVIRENISDTLREV